MNILIADDDVVSRRLLQVSLTNAGYQVQIAVDGAEALRAFEQQECPRLVVMDWMMPKMDGLEVCRAIRKLSPEPYIYIILLTSKGQQEEILEGLEAGADDYITKPFDLQELKARVRAGKRILDLQEQIVATREQLRVQATHDALTGLLNRGAILERLEKELARSAREATQISVIMADLDHFKRINDTYGHLAGDAVLHETAQRIQASMRVYDSVGRYGGEEFLVVSAGCGLPEAAEQAERFRKLISQQAVRTPDCAIPVTMS